jgi:hypothetical protein
LPGANLPFIPHLGLKELTATWEMLMGFRLAIRRNQNWHGEDVQAVAMGLEMITQMEHQYRAQVELARNREKEDMRKTREAINEIGGIISDKKIIPN